MVCDDRIAVRLVLELTELLDGERDRAPAGGIEALAEKRDGAPAVDPVSYRGEQPLVRAAEDVVRFPLVSLANAHDSGVPAAGAFNLHKLRYAPGEGGVMTDCRSCGEEVDRAFRYCPWCAAPLRIKVTELFPGRAKPGEEGKALRVSRYFGDEDREPEVRFSVWHETQGRNLHADAAVSLEEEEAARLGRFLADVPAVDEAQTL